MQIANAIKKGVIPNPVRHNNLWFYTLSLVLEILEKIVKSSCLTAEFFAGSSAFFGGSGVLSCNVCNGFKLLTYDKVRAILASYEDYMEKRRGTEV